MNGYTGIQTSRHKTTLFPPGLSVPGQRVEEGLEFLAHDADHPALDGVVGNVDKKDEGRGLRKLVVLFGGV